MALIFALSSLPLPARGGGLLARWHADKIAHALEHAVLAALWWRALRVSGTAGGTAAAWIAFALASVHGVLDELHQRWTPGRDPSVLDAVADAAGAALGALAAWRLSTTQERCQEPPPRERVPSDRASAGEGG